MISTYSLHKINSSESFSFSPVEYSRFKFGDGDTAKSFGYDLADGFIRQLTKHPIHKQIVVMPSPYSFIPTAAFSMKCYFVFQLNRWLVENNFSVVQEAKIHRTTTYKVDYGELSAEERINLISNDSFYIDKAFLKNKTILCLDDIKITGSHEKMIMRTLKEYELDNEIHLLYFAELTNKNIPPTIENTLNYYYIKSIFDLTDIIKSTHFFINTRTVKYILNYDFDAFCIFLQNQEEGFINQLYDMALGNSYHNIEAYTKNLSFIKKHLFTNQHKVIHHGN